METNEKNKKKYKQKRKKKWIEWRGRTTHSDFRIFFFTWNVGMKTCWIIQNGNNRDRNISFYMWRDAFFFFAFSAKPYSICWRPRIFFFISILFSTVLFSFFSHSLLLVRQELTFFLSLCSFSFTITVNTFFWAATQRFFSFIEEWTGGMHFNRSQRKRRIFNGQNDVRRDVAPGATNPHVKRLFFLSLFVVIIFVGFSSFFFYLSSFVVFIRRTDRSNKMFNAFVVFVFFSFPFSVFVFFRFIWFCRLVI